MGHFVRSAFEGFGGSAPAEEDVTLTLRIEASLRDSVDEMMKADNLFTSRNAYIRALLVEKVRAFKAKK